MRWSGRAGNVSPWNRREIDEWVVWSGRPDLNRRPPAPKAGALPGCATPRLGYEEHIVAAPIRARQGVFNALNLADFALLGRGSRWTKVPLIGLVLAR